MVIIVPFNIEVKLASRARAVTTHFFRSDQLKGLSGSPAPDQLSDCADALLNVPEARISSWIQS